MREGIDHPCTACLVHWGALMQHTTRGGTLPCLPVCPLPSILLCVIRNQPLKPAWPHKVTRNTPGRRRRRRRRKRKRQTEIHFGATLERNVSPFQVFAFYRPTDRLTDRLFSSDRIREKSRPRAVLASCTSFSAPALLRLLLLLLEDGIDRLPDNLGRLRSINGAWKNGQRVETASGQSYLEHFSALFPIRVLTPDVLLPVVVCHLGSLGVVGAETLPQRLGIVVGSLDQRLAGDVVGHGLLGRAIQNKGQRIIHRESLSKQSVVTKYTRLLT